MNSLFMNFYVYNGEDPNPSIKEIEKNSVRLFGYDADIIPHKGDYYTTHDKDYKPTYYKVIAVVFTSGNRPDIGLFAEGTHTELTDVDVFLKHLPNK